MNNLTIVNSTLKIKEFNNQRVVTFKDIDQVHQRSEGTARRNFNANKNHFIENDDFFALKPNVRNSYIEKIPPKGLTLLTETGYLMLVKSFTDDLAWTVQRELVNNYFKVKEELFSEDTEELKVICKVYKGKPVMTIKDLIHFSGLTKGMIRHYLNGQKDIIQGRDFEVISGKELLSFKMENNLKMASKALTVIYPAGIAAFSKWVPELPKESRMNVLKSFRDFGKMNEISGEMQKRYQRLTEANLLLTVADKATDPFYKEYLYQRVTQMMIEESIWTEECNGYQGESSDFNRHLMEGWNKYVNLTHSVNLMRELSDISGESLKLYSQRITEKMNV